MMYNPKSRMKSYIINLICVASLFALLYIGLKNGFYSKQFQSVLMLIFINIILAVSLNISTGYLGEIVLGHAGFMSIGAYTSALITKGLGVTTKSPNGVLILIFALICGGLVAALFGILVGIPALRLKGDYLAIITLGFGEIIRVLIEYFKFTGGAQGLSGIPRLSNLFTAFFIMVISVALIFSFVRSRFGRVLTAIREDDIASEAVGIKNTYYKVMAFATTAFFGGIAGGVYAHFMGIIGARQFNFNKSIDILVVVVLGGLGSMTGSIVSAIGLTILPEVLRSFSEYRMLIYSILLIIVMLFKPSGLFGKYEFSMTRLLEKIGLFKVTGQPPAGISGSGSPGLVSPSSGSLDESRAALPVDNEKEDIR